MCWVHCTVHWVHWVVQWMHWAVHGVQCVAPWVYYLLHQVLCVMHRVHWVLLWVHCSTLGAPHSVPAPALSLGRPGGQGDIPPQALPRAGSLAGLLWRSRAREGLTGSHTALWWAPMLGAL